MARPQASESTSGMVFTASMLAPRPGSLLIAVAAVVAAALGALPWPVALREPSVPSPTGTLTPPGSFVVESIETPNIGGAGLGGWGRGAGGTMGAVATTGAARARGSCF